MNKILIIGLFLINSLANTYAQTLGECIEYAKEHSLLVKQSDLLVARSKRNEGSYLQFDKTQLSLSQDPTSGGSPDNSLTLSQSIDFPTVYTTRRKMLKAETQVSESQKQLTISELTRDVSIAYTNLIYYHQLVRLYQKNDSVLDAFVKTSQVRLANGETNKLELMNARQQKADNLIQMEEAKLEMGNANLTLQQLMNTDHPIEIPGDSYVPICDMSNIQSVESHLTPGLQLLENEKRLKEQELSHIRQGYMPSFSLGTRLQAVIPSINPYDIERTRFEKGNWMGFEVGVSFPLFFGSQRVKMAVAKYDLALANTRLQEAKNQQQKVYSIAMHDYITAQNTYNTYEGELITQAHEMRRLSLVEYNAGEISYVEHIMNLTSALSVELKAAEALHSLNQAIITLNFVTGK